MIDTLPENTRVTVAAITDVGPVRARNEDAVLLPGMILAGADRGGWTGVITPGEHVTIAVLDGMGAHGGGSLASALSALAINEIAAEHPELSRPGHPGEEWLKLTLQRTSDLVVDVGALSPRTRIMGAATAGILLGESSLLVFHVGDCRCYVQEAGYLTLLTADHRVRGAGGALTRSLGGTGEREPVEPDFVAMDRETPRRYMLCTDGLTDTLGFDVLRELLARPSVEAAAIGLIGAAVHAGSNDNVTVIIADVPPTKPLPSRCF